MQEYVGLWSYYGLKLIENHGHRVHVTSSVLHLLTEEQREGLGDGALNCLNDFCYCKI